MKKGGVYAAIGEVPGKNASILTASSQQSADAAGNVASSIQQVATGSEKQVQAVNDTSKTNPNQKIIDCFFHNNLHTSLTIPDVFLGSLGSVC